MKPLLYVVRHGSTDFNGEGSKIRGWLPIPLAPKGHEEARQAAEKLQGRRIGGIVASPLHRAAQTAQHIGRALGMVPVPHEGLTTWQTGDVTGQPTDEVKTLMHAAILAHWTALPNAEPYDHFYDPDTRGGRWGEAVDAGLAHAQEGGDPLVYVTHEANLLALPHKLSGGTQPLIATGNSKTPKPGSVLAIARSTRGYTMQEL